MSRSKKKKREREKERRRERWRGRKKKLERKAVFLPQAHAPPSRRTSSKKPEVLNVGENSGFSLKMINT